MVWGSKLKLLTLNPHRLCQALYCSAAARYPLTESRSSGKGPIRFRQIDYPEELNSTLHSAQAVALKARSHV